MTESDRDGRLIDLDEATCRQLLRSHHVGRIAFNHEPSPEIFPVNYAVRDDTVVFHSGAGAKQIAASRGQPATFQVDASDDARHSGWSVAVRGRLSVSDETAPEDLPDPLPGGERPYVVVLTIDAVSGRRIPPEQGWVLPRHVWRDRDGSDLMG